MRNPKSLFNKACVFMNSIPVGSTYKTSDYRKTVGQHETSTRWKRSGNVPTYITLGYRGRLRQAGFTKQVKRGEWMVLQHIPIWFDSGHLTFILNGLWDSKTNTRLEKYDGMTKTEILAKLDHDRHHPNGVIAKQDYEESFRSQFSVSEIPSISVTTKIHEDTLLREQYPHNIEGDTMFKLEKSIPCSIEKISREESAFVNNPKPKYDIAEITNLGLLRSSISTLDLITTKDSVLHARVINAIVILQDIETSMSGKIDAQLFNGKL